MTRVDILSPHYDDAVLSCWNQIEQPGSQVITLFGGAPAENAHGVWDRVSTHMGGSDTVQIRREENHAALENTGATALNLNFLDRQYSPFKQRNVLEMADTVDDLLVGNTQLVAALGLGIYLRQHPDHTATRKVALELAQRGRNVAFFADIPYMLPARNFDRWPERISVERVKRALNSDVVIEPRKLSAEQQQRKRIAVQRFESQLPMVNRLALGALSRAGAYKWEALIRLV